MVGGDTKDNFWGAYQSDHTYVTTVTGEGTTVRGWYSDIPGYYGDNSGTMTVQLYAEVYSVQADDDVSWVGIDASSLLPTENDSDSLGGPLTIVAVSSAEHGTVSTDGERVTYTPFDAEYVGSDSFTYTVRNALGVESTATVYTNVLVGTGTAKSQTLLQSAGDGDGTGDDYSEGSADTEEPVAVAFLAAAPAEPPPPPTADKLTWNDFKKVDPPQKYSAETAYQYSVDTSAYEWKRTGVKDVAGDKQDFTVIVNPMNAPKLRVSVAFVPDKSYVVKKSAGNAKLLEHERLHLRIAEYIAEKARKNAPDLTKLSVKVTGVKKADIEAEAVKAIDIAVTKASDDFLKTVGKINDAVQTKYDAETNHSQKPKEQADWQAKYKEFVDAIAKDNGWKN